MRILYAGSGGDNGKKVFPADAIVTRLDIDPACEPDIVASMTDIGDIGEYDMVYSCHALEHLYPHEVPVALAEFKRVLKPGGHVVVLVPDLEDITPTEDVLFVSESGPITGLDLIYGHRDLLRTAPFMAHHTGFTSDTLCAALTDFSQVVTKRLSDYNLMAVGQK